MKKQCHGAGSVAGGWCRVIVWGLVVGWLVPLTGSAQSNWTVIGWNNLGMHCMDSDYSIFSILPPYNTFYAQVIDQTGRLVTNAAGIGVSYQAVADPAGSINRTSAGKTGFWSYEQAFFGIDLPMDTGLPVPGPESFAMPGSNNQARAMRFEPAMSWFAAHGVPITPYDDGARPNQYPMMRLTVTNATGAVLAMTDIVLPVSDEMDCSLCHASGAGPAAEPSDGWQWDAHPGRDYRLNILRLHDENNQGKPAYGAALATNGFQAAGLYATVTEAGRPVLCASCHLSEALPGSGLAGIPPLTEAMHGLHETVVDPRNGLSLGVAENRTACYTCHPGSETRCLRGAMGRAVAPDGSMLMQCQSCHGGMAEVGSPLRTGWLEEPNCQACHVGSATNAYGVIRFTDALTNGHLRVAAEPLFATSPDTPAPGLSLYRFSHGHGGLQCSACHGSTHAIYPTALPSDNIANSEIQGHAGTLSECTACHQTMPNTRTGGPHGMHRTGQAWIGDHNNAAQQLGLNACRTCHGRNGEGTVLSLAFSAKSVTSEKGNVSYFRGQKVSCWGCHDGMNSSDPTSKAVPVVADVSGVTTQGVPVGLVLGGANLRIIDQPRHGQVALNGTVATYYPDAGFAGDDRFTFAANNGFNDSNLGQVRVQVLANPSAVPGTEPPGIFAFRAGTGGNLGWASQLGGVYRVESSTNLLADGGWQGEAGALWGRTDATWWPDPAIIDDSRQFRVIAIDAPPIPLPATDDGAASAYDAGWNNLSDAGTGWGGWALSVTGNVNGGFFMAATNAAFLEYRQRSWGLWANSGATAEARRTLDAPLGLGEAVALWFENNFVNTGGAVGIDLFNTSGQLLMRFQFVGGQATYRVDDAAGSRTTRIPWTNKGLDWALRMVSDGGYRIEAGDYHVAGNLKPAGDQHVASIRIWNSGAGPGSDHDLYVNALRVVSR